MTAKDKGISVYQLREWPECSSDVPFLILAPSTSLFRGDLAQLQKIIGGTRAITSLNCKVMQSMSFVGFVGKDKVFSGVAKASNGWRLTALFDDRRKSPTKAKRSTPPSTKGARTGGDQAFFDALSKTNLKAPVSGRDNSGKTNPSDQTKNSAPVLSNKAIPDHAFRDIFSYRKLGVNFSQLMDMPKTDLVQSCKKYGNRSAPRSEVGAYDLVFRLCRAIAYSEGEYDLAKKFETRLNND
ncbi:MAG: hypothetical protein V7739_21100 [Motiliproteus sp.]